MKRFNLIDVHINVTLPIARDDDNANVAMQFPVMEKVLGALAVIRAELLLMDEELDVELEY